MTKVRDSKLLVQFGKKLKEIRMDRGLSQEDLANDADIPINQIGRIERGEVNPSLSTLYSISIALKLKLAQLLDGF